MGHSVMCHVHGFYPYFYAPAPNGFNASHLEEFKKTLDVFSMLVELIMIRQLSDKTAKDSLQGAKSFLR
jgi:hypothetical protein